MKKRIVAVMMSLVMLISLAPAFYAFSDVKESRGAEHIQNLKDRGIVSGDNNNKFWPEKNLSNAEAVSLLVKGFNLDLSAIRFIKEPKASDQYTKVKDDKWYSQAFIIGFHNQLVLDKDVDPDAPISRELFGSLLMTQVDRKGSYPLVAMYKEYKDESTVNTAYINDIQKLLLTNIGSLQKNDYFYPKQGITREDAAIWLDKALTFVETVILPISEQPVLDSKQLVLSEKAVNDEVKKVTITTEVPHPGYSMVVKSIQFENDTAYLDVQYVYPDPDKLYPQVITTVSIDTYVSSNYKVKVL